MCELKERDARELVINNLAYYPNEESMRVYLKSEADKVIEELKDSVHYNFEQFYNERKLLLHYKYKRCLAMAKICENKLGTVVKPGWWDKWRRRWLELAEKFKSNKDVV